jgi:hypothetical protein
MGREAFLTDSLDCVVKAYSRRNRLVVAVRRGFTGTELDLIAELGG